MYQVIMISRQMLPRPKLVVDSPTVGVIGAGLLQALEYKLMCG